MKNCHESFSQHDMDGNYFSSIFFLIKWLSSEGIIRPKMKILSSFTHPQVVSNLYEKQLMGP